LGAFVEFFSGGEFWHERIEILAKFGFFSRIFGGFLECLEWLGIIIIIFWKLRVLLQFSKEYQDRGAIYNKLRGFCAKFTGF
jgi:hypothetical protein